MSDETYKTIELHPLTSAQQALETSLQKFQNPTEPPLKPEDYDLCEFKSDGSRKISFSNS